MSQLQLQSLSQLQRFFIPFHWPSLDRKRRIVRGVCPSEMKGNKWNISPAAIKRAAGDYMEMPCVRAMHGIAAGLGLSVEFDLEGRGILAAQIVDNNEWEKVLEGVYRGFSIGGRPQLVRGNNIDKFEWIELILADRPEFREEVQRHASNPINPSTRRGALAHERRELIAQSPGATCQDRERKAGRLAAIDMALAGRF